MPNVFVVDDDASIRESLSVLIRSEGWQPKAFESAQEFLAQPFSVVPSCLILDVSLPATNSLELQKQLAVDRPSLPIIAISDRSDIPTTVQAMKAGAVEFLEKPLRSNALVCAIRHSLELSRAALDHEREMRPLRICHASLSPRERQVMRLVVSGLSNKQVGGELGISEITVKAHRGQVMQKMKAKSLPDLVMMATNLLTAVKEDTGLGVCASLVRSSPMRSPRWASDRLVLQH